MSALAFPSLHAAPSRGPYGPLPQTYELPKNAAHIHYVAPDGKPGADGKTLATATALDAALARAVTGDAIILRGGIYRIGNLTFNQGITFQPYADEQPILKGSFVADKWTAQRNGLWRAKWARLFPAQPADWWQRDGEGRKTPPWLFNNDMVFIDGRLLKTAGWEGAVDQDSCYIDYETGDVYIGADPTNRIVEITAFDNALTRTIAAVHGKTSDRKGPVIRGLTFTQYAYRAIEIEGTEPEGPAEPGTYGRDVVGTTLEHVTITHCSRVAGYFRGDGFTLRHCLISDTSTEGIYILSSSDCLLEKNIFARNNIEQITGYYPAAVKIFNQSHRVTCRDNLVLDQPHSNGIWYDVGNRDGVFVNNWIQDCEDGFFFEISKGVLCVGNVFVNCHKGVRSLNSSGVRVYHNTFVNTVASFERTARSAVADHFGWHPATGPDVDKREGHEFVGNLLVADANFDRELLRFEQARSLCGKLTNPQAMRIDDNLYVRPSDSPARALIVWSPSEGKDCTVALASPAGLNQLHPQFETRSRLLPLSPNALFKSPDLQSYEPIRDIALPDVAPLPGDVQKLLVLPKSSKPVPGACQP
ncbi:hypothetical protein AW736_09410 [Termitidicoccus mucosus]|uniref:Right handed beta helix domain-containing protein n=1 Tax=Termitidicoccus mucosus TaxID=1184151 RepID=A0A178IJZ6_9BACT|nr:hypothetical protein AW736_09410 [Opitutaceae bacterium TSB47]